MLAFTMDPSVRFLLVQTVFGKKVGGGVSVREAKKAVLSSVRLMLGELACSLFDVVAASEAKRFLLFCFRFCVLFFVFVLFCFVLFAHMMWEKKARLW
jgi:hypothetical protein